MKLVVLGSPVAHSLSPVMQQAALAAAAIPGSYEARDVDAAGFAAAVMMLRDGRLGGANVTMPHKALAYELCDVREPEAERAAAVNTLSVSGTDIVGSNTDVRGIAAAWQWRELPQDAPVNILGSGGAAAAALVALDRADIWIVARRPERAVAMIERTGVEATVRTWGQPLREGVLVNATPLGMRGDSIPSAMLAGAVGLFDMAYGDRPTPAVATMRERGLPVVEGLDMLVGQAVGSFEIWTGATVDPMVMRAAADRELIRRAEQREQQ